MDIVYAGTKSAGEALARAMAPAVVRVAVTPAEAVACISGWSSFVLVLGEGMLWGETPTSAFLGVWHALKDETQLRGVVFSSDNGVEQNRLCREMEAAGFDPEGGRLVQMNLPADSLAGFLATWQRR